MLKELPANPVGWTKHMQLHMNFGSDGGSAVYSIKEADGKDTGLSHQYDTRDKTGGSTGFFIRAEQGEQKLCKTWGELQAHYAEWAKTQDATLIEP